jgi:hypothetical protein
LFKTDKEDKSPRIRGESERESDLKLYLINFNHPLGTGNIEPLEIGTSGSGKKLFINCTSYKVGASDSRTIHFTIYKEK